jgi:general secretion pathway protein G
MSPPKALAAAIRRFRHAGFSLVELMLAVGIAATLAAVAVPSYSRYQDRARIAQAKSDIKIIELAIERFKPLNVRLPLDLAEIGYADMRDPWGAPYQFLNFDTVHGKGQMRKDRNLVPINSDYDLYSMGKDGRSVPPLTAAHSHDDIVRANNGSYVGLAKDY